ncbi:MAG: hypothetical protein CSA22_09490 [Deltaproteobacteria bacterium]|nr:MAG: hypothetical protein CSA22_09490 [Deltaproteobacteria bacterium]
MLKFTPQKSAGHLLSIPSYQAFRKSFQLLASKLQYSPRTPLHTLLVVGAAAGVGTTTVAIGFARFLAEVLQQKVLLVDADYRTESAKGKKKDEKAKGFCELLAHKARLEEVVVQQSDFLDFLPRGDAALLSSTLFSINKDMKSSIDDIASHYAMVIIDASPLAMSPGTYSLAHIVDGVIVVAQAEKTRKAVLQNVRDQLQSIDAFIAGAVLNKRKFHIPAWLYNYL